MICPVWVVKPSHLFLGFAPVHARINVTKLKKRKSAIKSRFSEIVKGRKRRNESTVFFHKKMKSLLQRVFRGSKNRDCYAG